MLQYRLEPPDLMFAGAEAQRRRMVANQHKLAWTGGEPSFELDAIGCKGELAFARLMRLRWESRVGETDFPGYEVKTRNGMRKPIFLKTDMIYKFPPTTRYVLAWTTHESASVYFPGWITGAEVEEHPATTIVDHNGECLVLEAEHLHPMSMIVP